MRSIKTGNFYREFNVQTEYICKYLAPVFESVFRKYKKDNKKEDDIVVTEYKKYRKWDLRHYDTPYSIYGNSFESLERLTKVKADSILNTLLAGWKKELRLSNRVF